MKVLYNFGRAEDLDRAAVGRLIASLTRLLGESPAAGLVADGSVHVGGLPFTESRPLGGAWVLDALWSRLGIAKTLSTLLGSTRRDVATERGAVRAGREPGAGAVLEAGAAGRYQLVAGNLRVKEVKISEHERFVICHSPEAADRDALVRTQLVDHLGELIKNTDKLSATKRAELRGVISAKPGLNRFLRVTSGGLLRIDAAAITAEAKLDGKYLLRSNDPALSAEDIALGYKQLLEVERGWRDMKQILDLRPVHHRLEDRIRAHVVLCWLALLIRIIETTTGDTWTNVRRELQRLHLGTFIGDAGT